MPPAARLTDMHTCPMVTPGVPPVPHVGGPIVSPGVPTVLIEFLPAATVTHMAICVGPPDTIVKGSATVLIGNLPAARIGDMTAHGGVIIMGAPTVIIGDAGGGGAGSSAGQGMGASSTSGTAASSQNPSHYSEHASPVAMTSIPQHPAPVPAPPQPPVIPPHGPGVSLLPPVKKPKEIVCGIKPKTVTVTCQHGRKAQNGLLEVVAEGRNGSDVLQCVSQIIGTCGQHPDWEIQGPESSKKIGVKDSFAAHAVSVLPPVALPVPIWLGYAEPKVYTISVSSCSGPSYSFTVHVYAQDAQSPENNAIKIIKDTYDEFQEKLEDVLKFVSLYVFDEPEKKSKKPGLKFKFLEGEADYLLQWQEDPGTNLAYYQWKLTLGYAPFFSMSGRYPIGPTLVPPVLDEIGNACFFVDFKGALNLHANCGQMTPPSKGQGYVNVNAECTLGAAIGGSLYIGFESRPLVSVEVSMKSGISASATGMLEDHQPKIEIAVRWPGLSGTVEYQWLFDSDKISCSFIEGGEIWKTSYYPFRKS